MRYFDITAQISVEEEEEVEESANDIYLNEPVK